MNAKRIKAIGVLALAVAPIAATAQTTPPAIDTLVNFVDDSISTKSNNLSGFAYDAATDTVYTTAFGADATFRKIAGASTASPVVTDLVEAPQLQEFYTGGNTDLSVLTPLAFSIQLNPKPIVRGGVTIGAGQVGVLIDSNFVVQGKGTASETRRNELSHRVYLSDLRQIPSGARVGDYLTSLITKANVATAIGLADANTTRTNDAPGRQFTFSSDGQSIYYVDSQVTFGGVYRVDLRTDAVSRIVTEVAGSGGDRISTEPAVQQVSPGMDRIFFEGSTTHGNVGGVNYADYDGTSAGPVKALLGSAKLSEFLGTNAVMSVLTISSDDGGNLYLDVTGGSTTAGNRRNSLLRLDPQGRLSKVLTNHERSVFFGERASASTSRNQVRTVPYVGPEGTYPVTQILYREANSLNIVAGVYAFEPGDFNRDDAVDQDDVALLRSSSALTPRGVRTESAAKFRFDMNGDSFFGASSTPLHAVIDWRDVKVFQQFYAFEDGDANIDLTVDWGDLDLMRDNYLSAGKIWFEGDVSGDDLVNGSDLALVAGTWDLAIPTYEQIDGRYEGTFQDAVASAFNVVPEPGTLASAALAAVFALGRRARRGKTSEPFQNLGEGLGNPAHPSGFENTFKEASVA